MYKRIIKYSIKHFSLIKKLSAVADRRLKPQIATARIATAIVCMHLASLGSLNSLSQTLHPGYYPSVSTIARVADSMKLEDIRDVIKSTYMEARAKKMPSPYLGMWVGIIDGHEIATSPYCKCSYCKRRKRVTREGAVYQYYHQYTAFILAGSDFSFTLDIEPVIPGQGEKTSAYSLLKRVLKNYPRAFGLVIGDGLYLNGKIFNLLRSHHKKTVAVLKEERRQLSQEAEKLSLLVEPEVYRVGNTTYRVWDHNISGCWDGYGADVRVIASEETTVKRIHSQDGKGWTEKEEVASWMWATNLSKDSMGDLKNTVKVCHARWHIENRCFNETVNAWKGDHIYRHTANAIVVFLLFLFMAINVFNIFFRRNVKDRSIRTKVFLMERIKSEFLALKLPLPLPPIPI